MAGKVVLYASSGELLARYDVDVDCALLSRREVVALPALVQEASLHPSGRYLYVAWSNGIPVGGDLHGLSAFSLDPVSGVLRPHGGATALRSRPIDVTTDQTGSHVLVAYNNPSGVTVHRILPDGSVGSEVKQSSPLDGGIYGHQVRVDPSNKSVILVTRGNGPAAGKAEDPGALKIFDYKDGVLANKVSIAPGGGLDFQSRHMDFDPAGDWVYVTLERQNKLHVYERRADGTLGREPVFVKSTLAAPHDVRPRQMAGSIHVHPDGRFVYVANRADTTTASEGRNVFAGGENSIAVYQIHKTSGEPKLIQTIDTRGIRPHTFAIDSIGRILVAANSKSLPVLDGGRVVTVPASLAVFRIRDDGCLEFVQSYDVELSDKGMVNWMGIVSLPEYGPRR